MSWYLKVLKHYAVFYGRAQRMEYWYFVLISTLVYAGFAMIDHAAEFPNLIMGSGPLAGLYSLGVLLPELAVTARRLHDTNHSGWWQLIFAPIIAAQWLQDDQYGGWSVVIVVGTLIGLLVLLLWMVRDGDPDENRWGPNPKEAPVAAKSATAR